MESHNLSSVLNTVESYSSQFEYKNKETVIILAAGHGKRIKSQTSKMLHKIWKVPTVERVYNACNKGLIDSNIIIVVGIKAEDVIKTIGKKSTVSFAYQEVQNGTGHAVQIALDNIKDKNYKGTVYIFPGDMGLIDSKTVKFFKEEFEKSNADMMVLTGIFEGAVEDNYYGRILHVKDKDAKSIKLKNKNKVIKILEYKDILSLDKKKPYTTIYSKKNYKFTQKELLENREFNSGVYAFKFKPLNDLISKIQSNNVQNEIYLTDLIGLFNNNGYSVEAISLPTGRQGPQEQYVLMGFNNKSVLKEMDAIARKLTYEKLKDIITIEDQDDFFIEENVVDEILKMDKDGIPLDIQIGKGVYIGRDVKLNYALKLSKNVFLEGKIKLGKNIVVKDNVQISCFYGQTISIDDNVEIYSGNIIKGNVHIGKNSKIKSGVRISGSDNFPTHIGSNVTVKGLSYIFGSYVSDNIMIEHSVISKKKLIKPEGIKADIYHVKYILPEAEGLDAIQDL
ncbi:MAG: NTP transferase domain-containing protein [Ignavibacteriales bacterium]|nr:NTP transferase domain-containing protein [Ignavibacteriales bacterium]